MCQNIHYFSQIDQFRSVAICKHGKFQLSWDDQILFLSPAELNKLEFVLDTATSKDSQYRHYEYLYDHDLEDESASEEESFDVWIGRYAIRLSPFDYLEFGSMISKARNGYPLCMTRKLSHTEMSVEKKINSDHSPLFFSKN